MLNWNLLQDMNLLEKEMNNFFNFGHIDRTLNNMSNSNLSHFSPRLHLEDAGENFQVEVFIPGVHEDDIELNIENNVLSISGSRQLEDVGEETEWVRKERMTGSFSRNIELPTDVDTGHVEASLKEGILRIKLPKAESARPKRIEIKAG